MMTALSLLFVWPLAGQDAVLARGPYLQNVRADSAVVMWTTTGGSGNGTVRVGNRSFASTWQALPPEVTALPETIYQHRARVTGLQAGQRYRYQVLINGTDVLAPETLEFGTPAPDAPFEFLVFGDSGDGGGPQRQLADRINRERPDLVLHTGDIAYYEGTYESFENYHFRIYAPLMRSVPFFPVAGNHDYDFENGAAFVSVHDLPTAGVPSSGHGRYYSFDWGNVHFTAVDSNLPLLDALERNGPLLRWLESDLSATSQTFRVVYFHHTPFPTANYRGNSYCERVRSALTGILERQGVHLALMGHEHLFQRTKAHRDGVFRSGGGTVYVTTGGAGSNLYPPQDMSFLEAGSGAAHYLRARVTSQAIRVEALGVNGEVLDQFTITPGPLAEAAVDAAAGRPMLAPGGLSSLFGWALAPGQAIAERYPLPREWAGASVKVGGLAAPLLFISRNQINFQVPYAVPLGETSVTTTHAGITSSVPVVIRPLAPAIFHSGGRPAVTHGDGSFVSSVSPARAGEWLVVYLTGLGAAPGLTEGEAAGAARVTQPVRVELDGMPCEILYAGLTPGLAGVNQINWRVPPGMMAGIPILRISDSTGSVVSMAPVPVRQ